MFLPLVPDLSMAHAQYSTDRAQKERAAQRDPYTMTMLQKDYYNWDRFVKENEANLPASIPELSNPTSPNSPPTYHSPSSAKQTKKPKAIDYANAEIAKHYKMSKNTAYQEALANTSYQRSVKDMQAAGLNPSVLFGASRASGAASNIYPMENSGGSSARSYGRAAAASDGKLFSSGAYNVIQTIGGLIGIATTKRPDGFWIGSQTAKGAMSLLDSIWK